MNIGAWATKGNLQRSPDLCDDPRGDGSASPRLNQRVFDLFVKAIIKGAVEIDGALRNRFVEARTIPRFGGFDDSRTTRICRIDKADSADVESAEFPRFFVEEDDAVAVAQALRQSHDVPLHVPDLDAEVGGIIFVDDRGIMVVKIPAIVTAIKERRDVHSPFFVAFGVSHDGRRLHRETLIPLRDGGFRDRIDEIAVIPDDFVDVGGGFHSPFDFHRIDSDAHQLGDFVASLQLIAKG